MAIDGHLCGSIAVCTEPVYLHKGKTYKDVAAYRMEEIIDLNTHTPSTPILCEQQVPEHQSTLSYKVALPLYVRGIFFSRDSPPRRLSMAE